MRLILLLTITASNLSKGSFISTELKLQLPNNTANKHIKNKDDLKKLLKSYLMYHYWCKSEYEIVVGGLHADYPEKFEKIDIWTQIEMNFDHIIDYIIEEMKLF